MGQNTKIEWTDHSWNPWIGCTKVSPGCQHCYAEQLMDKRLGKVNWGPGNPRQRTSAANWKQVERWNRQAYEDHIRCDADGKYWQFNSAPDEHDILRGRWIYPRRPRVFVASLADWLDPEVPIEWLADLLDLIRRCPHLDFLMLTKRPELWRKRLERVRDEIHNYPCDSIDTREWVKAWLAGNPPANVWIGTSVEDQPREERLKHLFRIPAQVRFVSGEPLLQELDGWWLSLSGIQRKMGVGFNEAHRLLKSLWVICGGESGPNARPMHPDWARSLRDQCQAAGVAFFMKQMGGTRKPFPEIPEDLMIREFPESNI